MRQLFAAANEQESTTYHVTVHGDVSGALKSLSLSRADFFTVILLDALQPDEALLALMKFEIPIVMLLSEGDGPAVIRNCIRRGAAPFLMTGIDTDLLLAVLHERVAQALDSVRPLDGAVLLD